LKTLNSTRCNFWIWPKGMKEGKEGDLEGGRET
jgi:hypothetical protein